MRKHNARNLLKTQTWFFFPSNLSSEQLWVALTLPSAGWHCHPLLVFWGTPGLYQCFTRSYSPLPPASILGFAPGLPGWALNNHFVSLAKPGETWCQTSSKLWEVTWGRNQVFTIKVWRNNLSFYSQFFFRLYLFSLPSYHHEGELSPLISKSLILKILGLPIHYSALCSVESFH